MAQGCSLELMILRAARRQNNNNDDDNGNGDEEGVETDGGAIGSGININNNIDDNNILFGGLDQIHSKR